MKLASFQFSGRSQVGVVDAEKCVVFPLCRQVSGMLDLIRRYDKIKSQIRVDGDGIALTKISLEAPIPRPFRNIICVGKNYREHAQEFTRSGFDSSGKSDADAIPKAPIIFTKAPECVIADGAPIQYPRGVSDQVDYEAELAVVIGRTARRIQRSEAYHYV